MIQRMRALCAALCLLSATPVLAESIDINRASAEEIAAALNGVGIQRARAIVAWREAHGPFKSIDALTEVKGIGPATVEKNRQRIRLGTPQEGGE
ncbi:MAG TPA: helix-hairpin-helix domain-containing protein [Thiotrichales bacterium]|nr:helix-hairpin-helix domain-containing protein [Thiotrichales bacterium]